MVGGELIARMGKLGWVLRERREWGPGEKMGREDWGGENRSVGFLWRNVERVRIWVRAVRPLEVEVEVEVVGFSRSIFDIYLSLSLSLSNLSRSRLSQVTRERMEGI